MSAVQPFNMSMLNTTVVPDSIVLDLYEYYNVYASGDGIIIIVTASSNWTLTKSRVGCDTDITSGGSGDTYVNITWTNNGSKFCRYGHITFTCGTAVTYFEWSQVGTFDVDCAPI